MKKFYLFVLVLPVLFLFSACDEDGSINIFTLQQDVDFGEEFDREMQNNPEEYPILDAYEYAEAYEHLDRIMEDLLASDDLRYAEDFPWKVRIVKDDEMLNAFCLPGGYMYFYTGIIKYLDDEAQFAGVVAHEMAHADRRHVTKNLTKQYGFSILLSALLGDDPSTMEQIAAELALGLGNLAFSRDHEYEADSYAVNYTADGEWDPLGIAGFFERMEGGPQVPEFLSTHPNPGNRIDNINETWVEIGSPEGQAFSSRYQDFKNSLP